MSHLLRTVSRLSVSAALVSFASHGLLNLYAGLRSVVVKWDVNLWTRNLFDEDAETTLFAPEATSPGYRRVAIIPGRTVGMTGTYNFGR